MLDGSAIAAILTGILALGGVLATAWNSSWNEQRKQKHVDCKLLARFSVPLLIASWDLANWFYDILHEDNYSKKRCDAYGNGWSSPFTSFLIRQYFAGVHIIREMTHFFANMRGEKANALKTLLWKIQDEFISMHYEGRENLEMRWFEGDILAVQEHLTAAADLDGDGNAAEMRAIGWVEFQKKYNDGPTPLKYIFEKYENHFQGIIYRRFKRLYSTKWADQQNPQGYNREEEDLITEEREKDPNIGIVVPDHRIRRLQHLLRDLVDLLDEVSMLDFQRPVRRCTMLAENYVVSEENPLGLVTKKMIPCDCTHRDCVSSRTSKTHFPWRNLDRVGTESDILEGQSPRPPAGKGNVILRRTTYGNTKTEDPSSV
jgi:hypothetical protein